MIFEDCLAVWVKRVHTLVSTMFWSRDIPLYPIKSIEWLPGCCNWLLRCEYEVVISLINWIKTPPPSLYDFLMQRYDLTNSVPMLLTSIKFFTRCFAHWALDAEIYTQKEELHPQLLTGPMQYELLMQFINAIKQLFSICSESQWWF